MHLGRLIRGLPDDFRAEPAGARHAEVDDPHCEVAVRLRPCQQDVFHRDVAMHDSHAMQSVHAIDDLHHDRQQAGLPYHARRITDAGRRRAECEEVSLGGELGDDVGALDVSVRAQELASVREVAAAQHRCHRHVPPWPLRLIGPLCCELLGARSNPIIGNALHRDMPRIYTVEHQEDIAAIARRIHQLPDHLESGWIPHLHHKR
mmetsp:Transcript_125120/g.361983  ORF Transcript_125120/g.361983 Transcript_125120/m.361983 type:complete len:205 (-) Transcript_125120:207-821(-)